MIEPLACVVSGQKRLKISKDQTVLVIGAGISGLCHVRLAKVAGARVIATDINEYRLRKASGLEADHVMNAATYSPEVLRQANNGRLADTVIVCAGAEKAVADAIASIDKRGTILFFAAPQKPIELPSVRFWREEISVIFSYGAATGEIKEALELIATNRFDARKMISHRIPLSKIIEGFGFVAGAGESLKVVVIPDSD